MGTRKSRAVSRAASATNARAKKKPTVRKREKRYTARMIAAALRATGGMISLAAQRLKCEPSTIYRRLDQDSNLKQVLTDEREKLIDLAESALRKKIGDGDIAAVIFTLKTVGKKRGYIEKQEIEWTGGAIPVTVNQAIAKVYGESDSERA